MDLKEVFVEYDKANEAWEAAKASLDVATKARSEVVKTIALAIAPKKKLLRSGRELTIVARPVKSDGSTTFFFRGATTSDDVVEV